MILLSSKGLFILCTVSLVISIFLYLNPEQTHFLFDYPKNSRLKNETIDKMKLSEHYVKDDDADDDDDGEFPLRSEIANNAKRNKQIEDRFRARGKRVKKVCAKYNHPGKSESFSKNRMDYSARYDLLVCLCGKAGTSTWITHLLHMEGITLVQKNIRNPYHGSKINAKRVLGNSLDERIKTSTKVVTIRHPLERLVSAFRDKFLDGRAVDQPQSKGHFGLFWKPAMKYHNKSLTTDGKYQITFTEFLKYVVHNQRQGRMGDRHWTRIFMACSVCSFEYDYILKLETFTQDLFFLKNKFNITEIDEQHKHSSKVNATEEGLSYSNITEVTNVRLSTLRYYLQVSPELLGQIFSNYAIDFEMFNYEIPADLYVMLEKEAKKNK